MVSSEQKKMSIVDFNGKRMSLLQLRWKFDGTFSPMNLLLKALDGFSLLNVHRVLDGTSKKILTISCYLASCKCHVTFSEDIQVQSSGGTFHSFSLSAST